MHFDYILPIKWLLILLRFQWFRGCSVHAIDPGLAADSGAGDGFSFRHYILI